MEAFYLKNIARYHQLVNALDPTPKPRVPRGRATSNICVSARIRPLSEDEGFPSAIFPRPLQHAMVDVHDLYNHPRGKPILKSFDYEVDRLFLPSSTTKDVYEAVVADLVPYAWDGGIGTLFAYGQTGSGKTYTVNGLEQFVAETLWDGSLNGARQIYLTIIDLAGNAAFDLLNDRKPVSLLEDSMGVMQMVGANEHEIKSRQEMKYLIERAASFRRTAPTLKNDASSRSHAICRIRIQQPDMKPDGFIYMIDLAGSESARDVAVHGADRMRETREINMSLSVLKDCIRGKAQADALIISGKKSFGSKIPYIPFRQSALTKVLKHVFDPASARPCRTVVIACVNPSLADVGPTKNTMRFAELLRPPLARREKVDPNSPTNWSNSQLKDWIKHNSSIPPILPNVLAPRETGAQLLKISDAEFEYRCQKCPGVKVEHARALREKLWLTQLNSQYDIGPIYDPAGPKSCEVAVTGECPK